MTESLIAMADDERMGTLERDGKRLRFSYAGSWLASPQRYPLSLSMPLVLEQHPHTRPSSRFYGDKRVMESAESIANELQNEGLDHPIIPELAEMVVFHAAKCGELLR